MLPPILTLITAIAEVPEPTLLARLAAVAGLQRSLRARVAVQLRDPELSSAELFALGRRLRDVTAAAGISLVVNDRLDLALQLGADGVHLGHRSVAVADARALLGNNAFVSVACHSIDEVARAAADGADAALLSPIFATPGKGPPLGPSALRQARGVLSTVSTAPRPMALIALGGIDAGSAVACLAAGADGVAAIRADLTAALQELLAG